MTERTVGRGWYKRGLTWCKARIHLSQLADVETIEHLCEEFELTRYGAEVTLRSWGYKMLNGVWYRDRELQTECGKLSVDRDRELAAKWLPQLAKWDPKKKWFGTQSEFNEAMMFARKPQRWICFLLEMYYGKPHVPHHYSIFNCTREQALAIASMKRRESKAKWKACNGKKNMISATK